MKKYLLFAICFFAVANCFAQLDAKKIAADYRQGIVKILLFDSLAEKNNPGSGYIGRGSGFIVSEEGIIFTNRHVIEMCVNGYISYEYNDHNTGESYSSTEVYTREIANDSDLTKVLRTGYTTPIVQIYSGDGANEYKLYVARVLAMSVGGYDGAMLEIVSDLKGVRPIEKFKTLPIGNADLSVQGENLCVYGYPAQIGGNFQTMLNDMSTLTFGKMSGYDYVLNKDYGFIKTDASINSGNSGGPVFNESGKVIGIATATGNMTNIGLAGAVNGMYYIARTDKVILEKLTVNGLTKPKNSNSIATVTGERESILSPEEINKKIVVNSRLLNFYKNSKITLFFYKNANDPKPQAANKFLVKPSGGFIIIEVNNAPNILGTDQLTVEVWKKEGNDYSSFVISQNVAVKNELKSFRFKQVFNTKGEYKIIVYAHDKRLINTVNLNVSKALGNPRMPAESVPMKVNYGIFNSYVYYQFSRSIPTGNFAKQPPPFTMAPFSYADPFQYDQGHGAQPGIDLGFGYVNFLHSIPTREKFKIGIDLAMHFSINKIDWSERGSFWRDSVKYSSCSIMGFQIGSVFSYKLSENISADLNFDLIPTLPLGMGEIDYDNGKGGSSYNSFHAGGVGGFGVMNELGFKLRTKYLYAGVSYWFGKVNANYDFVYGVGQYVGGNYQSEEFKSKISVTAIRLTAGIRFGR